jgi:2-iminobutanoate/2-iminopropanoate deaminase
MGPSPTSSCERIPTMKKVARVRSLRIAVTISALLAPINARAARPVSHFAPVDVPPAVAAKGPPAFSRAVLAGDTLYLSGMTDVDPKTGASASGADEGARMVLGRVQSALKSVGFTMDDLVSVQVFAATASDYVAFNAAYRAFFTGPFPARAFIVSGPLMGGAHFEVVGIAVRSKDAHP